MTLDDLEAKARAAMACGEWDMPYNEPSGTVIVYPAEVDYLDATSPTVVLHLIAVVRAAQKMQIPALVGNRDRVVDFDAALTRLNEALGGK